MPAGRGPFFTRAVARRNPRPIQNERGEHWLATCLVAALFAVLTAPAALWPARGVFGVIWSSAYVLMALGVSLEFAEASLALLWRPIITEFATEPIGRGSAAVLMTICDDADPVSLASLNKLSESGYSTFILDDSIFAPQLTATLESNIRYLRRASRDNAKAGNLNNWLSKYSSEYDYIVLLDSDSIMTPWAIDRLVASAAHPANVGVAVFQAKVEPRVNPETSLLARITGIGARLRARIYERVHSRLGILLSGGRNQLIRTRDLVQVGGFSDVFSAEDTALSLTLSSLGLRTALVDVWSSDTEPATIEALVRRTVRWGRQTIEIASGQWTGVPIGLKLVICRHVFSYLLPTIGLIMLIISLATGPVSIAQGLSFTRLALGLNEHYRLFGVALWSILTLQVGSFGLRAVLTAIESRSPGLSLGMVLTGPILNAILVIPVTIGLVASTCGFKVTFLPTNAALPNPGYVSRVRRVTVMYYLIAWLVGLILLALAALRSGTIVLGFNAVWILSFLAAPPALLLLAKPRRVTSLINPKKAV